MSSALATRPSSAALTKDGERLSWLDLVRGIGNGQREAIFVQGTAPRLEDLAGYEFAGANALSLTRLIGIRKFVKGFYEGPARAEGPQPFVQGYNVTVRQNADDAEHILTPSPENPKRHGFYRVHACVPGARDSYYPNSLLLDYGLGGNGLFGPPLRDYIVQVYPDDPDLLLGKAYLALVGLRIPVSFFVLKRIGPHRFKG